MFVDALSLSIKGDIITYHITVPTRLTLLLVIKSDII